MLISIPFKLLLQKHQFVFNFVFCYLRLNGKFVFDIVALFVFEVAKCLAGDFFGAFKCIYYCLVLSV